MIHHFRSCRKDWKKSPENDCYHLERYRDTSLSDKLAEIEYDILELKYLILRDV